MTQTIAKKIKRGIARVKTWTETVRTAINNRLLAPHIQQRADDGNLRIEHLDDGAIVHSLKTRQPSAANEMHEDRFHLIIGSVPHGDSLRMEMTRLPHEKTIAHNTSGFFDRKFFSIRKGTHIPAL